MSHSKFNKKGNSLYIEKFNPKTKKYINTCAICGAQGYNPSIDCDGFTDERIRRVMRDELKKTFQMLALDDYGRCEICAKRMNEK
jgi:hypothetical protein